MTKGTRAFRIIICLLLGLTILWTAFISYAFIYVTKENEANKRNERYGILCYGAFLNYGAEIQSEIMCIDGLQNMTEN